MVCNGSDFMNRQHLNHVCLFDGKWRVYERMGKQIPFGLYPHHRHLGEGETPEEAMRNSSVPMWDIEVIEDDF